MVASTIPLECDGQAAYMETKLTNLTLYMAALPYGLLHYKSRLVRFTIRSYTIL